MQWPASCSCQVSCVATNVPHFKPHFFMPHETWRKPVQYRPFNGIAVCTLYFNWLDVSSVIVLWLICTALCGSRDSSGSVVTLRAGRLGEGMHFFVSTACRPAPGCIQQNIQWLLGIFFQVRNVQYVSRPFPYSAEISISGYIPPFPHTPLWRATQLSCGTQLCFSVLHRKFRIDNILCKLMT